jgi:aryl-alcohol dehydrogenase-like predicted oxidoreductase
MDFQPVDFGFDGPPEEAWPELALRFTLSQPEIHTAIIGTTSVENARANLRAAEKGPLPEETVRLIKQTFRMGALKAADGWPALV